MIKPWKWLALVAMAVIAVSWMARYIKQAEQADATEVEYLNRRPPVDNIVPDELTAVRLALVFLEAEYGIKNLVEWYPLRALFHKDRWVIFSAKHEKVRMLGGGFDMALSRKDGRVLYLHLTR